MDGLIITDATEGNGVLEIKCPMSHDSLETLVLTRKNFYLQMNAAGEISLKKTHQYYTQVQFEMAITGCKWADFVVFVLTDDCEGQDLHIEIIQFNERFWSKTFLPTLERFQLILVLELLSHHVRRGLPLLPAGSSA